MCPVPNPPPGHTVSLTLDPEVYVGKQIKYECRTGYALVSGNLTRTCTYYFDEETQKTVYIFDGLPPVCVGMNFCYISRGV